MIGKKLNRARLATKLSLRELAQRAGGVVSAQAIGRYENDQMMPSSETLLALAKGLNVSPEYLLRSDSIKLTDLNFRKSTSLSAKLDASVESKVVDYLQQFSELQKIISIDLPTWIRPKGNSFNVQSSDDAENAAQVLRNLWGLGITPITSLAHVLEQRSIRVLLLDLPLDYSGTKAIAKIKGGKVFPVILANKNQNPERQRFTYAHELAHLVLSFPKAMSEAAQEKLSDRFAGALLVNGLHLSNCLCGPRSALSIGELLDLKKEFRVSLAAMIVRCRQTGLITQALYLDLWSQVKTLGLNNSDTQEPNPCTQDTPSELERLCYFAVSESLISLSKAAEILQISARTLDRKLHGKLITLIRSDRTNSLAH